MLTQVKNPQDIFFSPQRLLVPLFQRPYVWSLEGQWRPLWEDVSRVAERITNTGTSAPHFLGAVVVQQQPNSIGTLSVRTVIDGQQRLTTLQVLLDSVHGQIAQLGLEGLARQAQDLVENQAHFTLTPEDRFKVWPTNRDRAAFNEVMAAPVPVDYSKLENKESRLVKAHEFFSSEISEWLKQGDSAARANALVSTVSRYLQLVVIDLQVDEDAQEIFETLNARGTPLTAADLIKNFVFQRLETTAQESERAYHQYWEDFETPFWEAEIAAGRLHNSRSSLFLTQWLISQTKSDITAREVFSKFKLYVSEQNEPVGVLLPRLKKAADNYKSFTQGATRQTGSLSRLELFVYRISTLDSEVVKPVLILLTDPDLEKIDSAQLDKALAVLESWFVRRAIVRASTKRYNLFMIELLNVISKDRIHSGDVIEKYLAKQSGINSYWPSDSDVRAELTKQPVYKRLARARLRMIIEALEDKRRGFNSTVGGKLSESSVPRSVTSIEHIMPQEWRSAWQGEDFDESGTDRDVLVHMLGNLTLVTQSLNSKVSNSAWGTKKDAFREHTTLLLTADVVNANGEHWDAEEIHLRSTTLANEVISIWPVPSSNAGLLEAGAKSAASRVAVADLVQAGFLKPGQVLFARTQAHRGQEAFVSEDGGIYVDGVRDDTPSGAAKKLTNAAAIGGWWFWLTDMEKNISLADLRNAYIEQLQVDDAEAASDEN